MPLRASKPLRPSIEKFRATRALFRCPICSEVLNFSRAALVCANGHTFNINRKGYVDLRRHATSSAHYTADFFENRLAMMWRGMYSQLISQLETVVAHLETERGMNRADGLDVGCGDGFITRKLGVGIGLDLSIEGIKTAARGGGDIRWVCADGAHLPLTTGSLPFILNVFAPSEYEDFARVAPGGILIKVVPGERHMHELRSLVGLAEDTPDSATVLFKKRVSFISSIDVIETLHLHTEEESRAVAHMSPVGFGKLDEVDSSEGGWKDLENITTHSRILVGRLP